MYLNQVNQIFLIYIGILCFITLLNNFQMKQRK